MPSVSFESWKSYVGTKRLGVRNFVDARNTLVYCVDVTFDGDDDYVVGGIDVGLKVEDAKKIQWAFTNDPHYQYVDGKIKILVEVSATIPQSGADDIVIKSLNEATADTSLDGKSVSLLIFAER